MNIKEIKISIINISNSLYITINPQNNTININGINKNIETDYIYNLLSIIRNWEHQYINPSIIDCERFKIEIIETNNIDSYEGVGNYPSNYQSFKEWIGGLLND